MGKVKSDRRSVALPPPVPGRTCPTSVTNNVNMRNRPIRNRQVQFGSKKHVVHWIHQKRDCDLRTSAYDRCINTGGSCFRCLKIIPFKSSAEKLAS